LRRFGAGGAAAPPGAGHRHRGRLDPRRADVRRAAGAAGRRMKVALRTDASDRIGTGHLMRCLTLADALRAAGARTRFVSRPLPRGLGEVVKAGGHELVLLPPRLERAGAATDDGRVVPPAPSAPSAPPAPDPPHAAWLGATQDDDAAQTLAALA